MTNNGFIIIPRRFSDWQWYSNTKIRLVFLDLLMRAAYDDMPYQGVQIHRGQVAISVPELATLNQLSIQQTRNVLEKLKSTGEITVERNPKFSIITLNSFDELQGVNTQNNSQSTVNCSQTQQSDSPNFNVPTYKNNKNNKTIKTNNNIQAPSAKSKSFYSKKSVQSDNSSFTLEDIMNKIGSR